MKGVARWRCCSLDLLAQDPVWQGSWLSSAGLYSVWLSCLETLVRLIQLWYSLSKRFSVMYRQHAGHQCMGSIWSQCLPTHLGYPLSGRAARREALGCQGFVYSESQVQVFRLDPKMTDTAEAATSRTIADAVCIPGHGSNMESLSHEHSVESHPFTRPVVAHATCLHSSWAPSNLDASCVQLFVICSCLLCMTAVTCSFLLALFASAMFGHVLL